MTVRSTRCRFTLSLARILAPVWLACTVATALPALSQEYCVACTEPDKLYRCVIDGARPGASSSLQLLCISALAKEGPHTTCTVRRGVTVIDCNGPIKHVSIPTEEVPASPSAVSPPAAPSPTSPPADQKADATQGDPKTVAEMLRRAKEQSDRDWAKTNATMKSNNEKVGSFFKKSWDCLSSLFSRCNDQ